MTSPNTLAAAIDNAVLYRLMNIHTAFPARILSYDYTKREASLQPLIDKKYRDGTTQPMPKLNNVPVIMPQAGSFFMNFPINTGDTCLVICCERSLDTWLQTGRQEPPNDPRKFDLSDAVAIMGLSPFSLANPAPNNTDTVIGYQGSTITIRQNGDISIKTAGRIAIGNNITEVLDVIASFLLDMTTAIYAPPSGVIDPSTLAKLQALKAKIDNLKGAI